MKSRKLIVAATAVVLLAVFITDTFAEGEQSLFTHASRGTIVSIDTHRLVLAHKKNGNAEVLNFVLTPDTVRRGSIAVGTRVFVHYRIENSRQIATSIQAQRPKVAELIEP